MTRSGPDRIEELLTGSEAPPPPEGLLERLQAEIAAPPANDRATAGRRRWLLAASLAVTVVGATLVYRIARDQAPTTSVSEPAAVAMPPREGSPETPELRAADTGLTLREMPPKAAGEAPAAAAPAEISKPVTEAPGAEVHSGSELRVDQSRSAELQAAAPIAVPQGEPRPGASGGESAPGAARRMLRSEQAATPEAEPAPLPLERLRRAPMKQLVIPDPTPDEPGSAPPPASTGGTAEPNDQPYGDMFFQGYGVNPFVDTEDDRLSTFGLDVDTGSYGLVRSYLERGHLPPGDAVRVEELLNAFDYGDAPPARGDFALHAQAGPAPFGDSDRYRLVRFGLRAREVDPADRKPATLVFVVDVSGSMNRENRLGLVKRSLELLLDRLRPDDRVGLVVYGDRGRVLLEPSGDLEAIRAAIGRLRAGGSTNAEEGLALAYDLLERHRTPGSIHRVLLCSDGVANVGRTGTDSILGRIGREAEGGIELTTVGFGMGNYNDVLMEQLADRGDGRYAYVDDLDEARRIFVEGLTGTLQTIAFDAKAQVEFDSELVTRWRLLGYENRDVADERFRDDTVDAGEIGAGHTVTALYEIKLAERPPRRATLATLRLRYRSADTGEVVEVERPLRAGDVAPSWEASPRELQLAAVVAELGELLKGSFWARNGSLDEVFRRAQAVSARYPGDVEIAELASLAGRAARLASGAER